MNDITPYAPGPLPKPRKLPKQGRSRILVDSLKQACLQILQREGQKALTATRIASVSGVAMGSLYQYFPNVDAIVVAAYEDLLLTQGENSPSETASAWRDSPEKLLTLRHSDCPGSSELLEYLLKLAPAVRGENAQTIR